MFTTKKWSRKHLSIQDNDSKGTSPARRGRKEVKEVEATRQNFRIADQVLTILAKENCTVLQAAEILTYVSDQIRARSTVQFNEGDLTKRTDTIDQIT